MNHPISVGGVIINPGDIVIGDDDGVVVVPHDEAKETLISAQERRAKEEIVIQRIKNGESVFDIYGYQKTLDLLNCKEDKTF
ncbi:TPA: hypothetical protein P4F70_000749 [Escherichia coli]|nr:hypothetical protein [Escherichia coli]